MGGKRKTDDAVGPVLVRWVALALPVLDGWQTQTDDAVGPVLVRAGGC